MRNLFGALALALLTSAAPVLAGDSVEDELIAKLASPSEDKVTTALGQLEEKFPTSTNALPVMKKLLTDSRVGVRRKAAVVLGAIHAEVDQTDIKNICAFLKDSNPRVIIAGLKALRGLNAPTAVPEILPCLNHTSENVIRDACRTLAVLGNKETIPAIEPLLKSSHSNVRKDAQKAIDELKAK